MKQEVLRLDWITKSFDGVSVLQYANFNLYAGEIHALMGSNGVGKSTLMRIITGKYPPDSGRIFLNDALVEDLDTLSARSYGVYNIESNPDIVPQFDLTGNVAMQLRQEKEPALYDEAGMRAFTRHMIAALELQDILRDDLSGFAMSILEKQCLQILCAVANGARILVADEPFSTLDTLEAIALKKLLLRVRLRGIAILLASHSTTDVAQLADRVTVLRAGSCAATFDNPHTYERLNRLIIQHMLGGNGISPAVHSSNVTGREIFRADDCNLADLHTPVSFNVRAGEVLGIVSFGAFRTSICESLFGLGRRCTGSFHMDGKPVSLGTPKAAMQAGIGFMSDDDESQKIVPQFSIDQNITLPFLNRLFPSRIPAPHVEQHIAKQFQDFLLLDENDLSRPARYLSRGMQKRLALARWFCIPRRLLMLSEPFKGLDAAGRQQLEQMISERTAQGAAFIIESSNYEAMLSLCDRVLLIRDNRMLGTLAAPNISKQSILSAVLSDSATGGDFIV